MGIFFTLIGFNLWTNFMWNIWLNKLLMLFKATSIYHPGAAPPPPPPLDPLDLIELSSGYLTQKKTVRGKAKGRFYPSSIFSISHFFLRSFFLSAIFSFSHCFSSVFFLSTIFSSAFFPVFSTVYFFLFSVFLSDYRNTGHEKIK